MFIVFPLSLLVALTFYLCVRIAVDYVSNLGKCVCVVAQCSVDVSRVAQDCLINLTGVVWNV